MDSPQTDTMQALVVIKLGDPTILISQSSPIFLSFHHPVPQLTSSTLVWIKVKAISVNFANAF